MWIYRVVSSQVRHHVDVVDSHAHQVDRRVSVPQDRHVLDHSRGIVALRNRISVALTINTGIDRPVAALERPPPQLCRPLERGVDVARTPIAECDNASRVIKYVAILGYRYYSYNLVEMRIHDINVVADLRRHNPIDPNQEQLDELEGGATGNPRTKNAIEGYGTLGAAAVTPSWTGPWPLLHLVCNYVYSVITLVFHVTVDLLDTVEVIDFYMGIAEGVAIPLTEIREASNQALALINEITAQEEEKFWAFTMAVTWGALKIVSLGMKAALWLEALFFALLATWWFSFMMTLAYAVDCILSGTWTQLASALALAGLFVTYLFGGIHSWLSGGSQAWSEFRNVFHPEALHGALNWPEGYEECFKLRTSFYMTMAQFAALAVVVITIVAIWFGWLS